MGFIKLAKNKEKNKVLKTGKVKETVSNVKEGREQVKQRATSRPTLSFQEEVVRYVIDNKATTRDAGEHFGISHMTVQRYIQKMAKLKDKKDLFTKARKILNKNASESTDRGGIATSDVYKQDIKKTNKKEVKQEQPEQKSKVKKLVSKNRNVGGEVSAKA